MQGGVAAAVESLRKDSSEKQFSDACATLANLCEESSKLAAGSRIYRGAFSTDARAAEHRAAAADRRAASAVLGNFVLLANVRTRRQHAQAAASGLS